MYNRFLGARNPEKDIERLLVDAISTPSLGDVKYFTKLTADAASSATTIEVNQVQPGMIADGFWVMIDPWTVQCEIRLVTAISGNTLTMAALDFAHNTDDGVIYTTAPIYNVKLFGALGDGSADDSSEIQAAIDAAPEDSTIYFPDGDYKITTSLEVYGRDHMTFTGPGTIKPYSVVGFDVQDTAGSSCEHNRFLGLHMVGVSNYAAIKFYSGNSTGVRHNIVRDCDLHEFSYGVRTQGGGGGNMRKQRIENNRMTVTNKPSSIGVSIESDDSWVRNNIIRGFETGINIEGKSNEVSGNHIFKAPSSSTESDIAVGRGLATTDACAGLIIANNYFDGQPTDGYLVMDVRAARRVTVIGNTFRGESTGGPFILFEVDAGNYDIQDITIIGNIFRCASGTLDPSITFGTGVTSDGALDFHMRWNVWNGIADAFSTGDEIRQVGTYAATYAPNPMKGRLLELTLTGNITISNPVDAVTGGIGNQLTFLFIQDDTGGRTVTWDSDFNNDWYDDGYIANAISSITFEWDGTDWNQVAYVSYPDDWVDYYSTSTVVGWTSTTTTDLHYLKDGEIMHVRFRIEGESDSADTTFTLPNNNHASVEVRDLYRAIDDGGAAAVGVIRMTVSSGTVTLYPTLALTVSNWTNSGTKSVAGSFWYKIA